MELHEKICFHVRKKFLTVKIITYLNNFTRDLVRSLTEDFHNAFRQCDRQFDPGSLSHERLDLMIFKATSTLRCSVILRPWTDNLKKGIRVSFWEAKLQNFKTSMSEKSCRRPFWELLKSTSKTTWSLIIANSGSTRASARCNTSVEALQRMTWGLWWVKSCKI